MSNIPISPPILYWGTPVVLISTTNIDGTANIAPNSSAWWLGNKCMLGLLATSQTTINLLRTGQCVLNMPSDDMTDHVNALARTTGTPDMPEIKVNLGYRYVKDKFGAAKLTQQASEMVQPPRAHECPVQMEAELVGVHEMHGDGPLKGATLAVEVRIAKTYVREDLKMAGHDNRIEPDNWSPMIMSFQQLYGLRNGKLVKSTLAEIEEELYRGLTKTQAA